MTALPKEIHGTPPRREGVASAPDVDTRPGAPRLCRLAAAGSLAELNADWRLFHTGLFDGIGRMAADPVLDWARETGNEGSLGVLTLKSPVLHLYGAGIPSQDYGNAFKLRAVPAELWPSLFQFLGRTSGVNYQERFFWRAVAQLVPVPDTRLAATAAGMALPSCPTVPAVLFGVDSTEGLFVWEPGPGGGPARLKRLPAEADTRKMADALFRGLARPLDALDPLRQIPES